MSDPTKKQPRGTCAVSASGAARVQCVSVRTCRWIESTVYPDVQTLSVAFLSGPALSMTFLRLTPKNITVTDRSISWSIEPSPYPVGYAGPPEARLAWAEGSAILNPDAPGSVPRLIFTPLAKLVATFFMPESFRAWFFSTPGELAMSRIPLLAPPAALSFSDGAAALRFLFETLPFLTVSAPAPTFEPALTPAFRRACSFILHVLSLRSEGLPTRLPDDVWIPRAEPSAFAILCCRLGNEWTIAGITAAAQTLTVRLEDLILRTPPALRAPRYVVGLFRDPIPAEAPAPQIEEYFADQPSNLRVTLDLAANGGFLISFRPMP